MTDSTLQITHIGGPTVLVEIGGWRLLTDPTFDAAGGTYRFGWGTGSRKLADPALPAAEVGAIDAVLLSHDQHDDNLDLAGRHVLEGAGSVITTVAGARRVGSAAIGLAPYASTRLEHPARPTLSVSATPCRHGPPLSGPIVGEVTGFALTWEGQRHGVFWVSGDTVLYDGVREVANRFDVGTAVLHLGGVRFPISGPLRYTMNADEGVELCRLLRPHTVIPTHYEGWKHFREGRPPIERAFAAADVPQPTWLELGRATEIEV